VVANVPAGALREVPQNGIQNVITKEKETAREVRQRETTVEFFASFAGVLVTGLFIITFILQAFEIPSSSMEDTLLIGDHVFVNREQFAAPARWIGPLMPYRNIRQGDVVVFLSPSEHGLFVVKRIIGIPGDRIHLRDGVVYRNGKKLDEPYVRYKDDPNSEYTRSYRENFPAVAPGNSNLTPDWESSLPKYVDGEDLVVPPGNYFAMGDNRNVSYDSRFWGFIPQENVIGRPMFMYWSFITPRDQYEKHSMGDRLGFLAHIVIHFFDETRWSRTLKVVQ
jgi:signal peptidase I